MTTVRFIGSGDAFGSGGRLQTCILVEDQEWRVLIDCGASSLIGLKAAGIDPATIDAVIISHLHGDHFAGLPFFLLDAQLNSRRSTKLTIAGQADLEQRLRDTMDLLFPGSQRSLDVVDTDFVILDPAETSEIGAATVQPFDVRHFCGSPPYAIRLTTSCGSVVTYTGDTEWTDNLIEAADGADLLIAEIYFYDKAIKWHLNYTSLAENLHRLRARRVIGTHLSSDMLNRSAEDLAIEVAHDGLALEL